ncbi:hypothetical protein [Mucilaginibacter sp. CSA2-8R]|uniref:hypothetical protein n=1 Tax=Mucilaginibacter sp. CSA2-8R TaxID=3141542 RepID=UPI00315D7295
MIRVLLLLALLLPIVISQTNAQTIKILSVQGKPAFIKLNHPSATETLSITSSKDTITLNNFWSLDTVLAQGKIFLKIDYAVRVGSNNSSGYQLWLFVDNGRLKQALHINSFRKSDYGHTDYSRFKANTSLTGDNATNYRLILNMKNKERHPGKAPFEINKVQQLIFSIKRRSFYDELIQFRGEYIFNAINSKKNESHFINQAVPVVNVLKDRYYFINGNWYTRYKGTFYTMAQI